MPTDINSLIKKIFSDETINGISASAGTNVSQTKTAVSLALPELIKALSKNSQSENGAQSLSNALDKHDGSLLSNILGAIKNSDTQTDGAKILGHALGDQEPAFIQNIASQAGITTAQSSGILQTVAPLLMEMLGKTKQEQGLNAGGITGILSGLLNNQPGGSLLGTLDQNKDGNYKDDLMTIGANWLKSKFFK